MDGLIIKYPWIDLILGGHKTWEIRGSSTKKRGTIALIQSGTGHIYGTAELMGSRLLTPEEYRSSEFYHCIPNTKDVPLPYKQIHAWELSNPVRLKQPISYIHPQGAVIWVHLPDLLLAM